MKGCFREGRVTLKPPDHAQRAVKAKSHYRGGARSV